MPSATIILSGRNMMNLKSVKTCIPGGNLSKKQKRNVQKSTNKGHSRKIKNGSRISSLMKQTHSTSKNKIYRGSWIYMKNGWNQWMFFQSQEVLGSLKTRKKRRKVKFRSLRNRLRFKAA